MKKRIPLLLLVRRVHLFLALFLMPWVLMYALSTIGMHHRVLFTGYEQRVHPGYELISSEPYARRFELGKDRQVAAREILRDLDMEGGFSVRGDVEQFLHSGNHGSRNQSAADHTGLSLLCTRRSHGNRYGRSGIRPCRGL